MGMTLEKLSIATSDTEKLNRIRKIICLWINDQIDDKGCCMRITEEVK